MKRNLISLICIFITSCSAIPLNPEAKFVKLVTVIPNSDKCKYLGEVASSDGRSLFSISSFRGAASTTATLIETAKNKLRNKTYLMGGNLVYMEGIENPNELIDSLMVAVVKLDATGKAYRCDKDHGFNNTK